MKPMESGMMRKNSAATSTTVGLGSIMPTAVSPMNHSTTNVTTPQARQNQLHCRNATRTPLVFGGAPVLADERRDRRRRGPQHHVHHRLHPRGNRVAGHHLVAVARQQPGGDEHGNRLHQAAGGGGAAHVQNGPPGGSQSSEGPAHHALAHQNRHVQRDAEHSRRHVGPGSPGDAQLRHAEQPEDQHRPQADLQQRAGSHHDAGAGRAAGGAQQRRAHHGEHEERKAEHVDAQILGRHRQHLAPGPQQGERRRGEQEAQGADGHAHHQHQQFRMGDQPRRQPPIAGAVGTRDHGRGAGADAASEREQKDGDGKRKAHRRQRFGAHEPQIDRLGEASHVHGQRSQGHERP